MHLDDVDIPGTVGPAHAGMVRLHRALLDTSWATRTPAAGARPRAGPGRRAIGGEWLSVLGRLVGQHRSPPRLGPRRVTGTGGHVPQASPRGTYLQISDQLRQRITEGKYESDLPSEADLMRMFGVGRSTVGRALRALRDEGLIESAQGSGWFVAGTGDRRPLVDKVADKILDDRMNVGDVVPPENALCDQFKVSRTAVRSALAQLEGAGIIGRGTNRRRVVRALPPRGGSLS